MSAVNRSTDQSIRNAPISKVALSVVSTITAYILVPVACHYAVGDFNKVLVFTVAAVWALALTRMWGEVISLTAAAMARIPVPAVLTEITTILPILPILAVCEPATGAAI